MVGYKGFALCNGTDDFSWVYFVVPFPLLLRGANSWPLHFTFIGHTIQWVVWRGTKMLCLRVDLQDGTEYYLI